MITKFKIPVLSLLSALLLFFVLHVTIVQQAQAQNEVALSTQLLLDGESNSATVPTFHENAVTIWDDAALNAVRFSRPGPPAVARALAMVHSAQYEAWSQYDEIAVGPLFGDRFRQPEEMRTARNKNVAMSYAAYRVLTDLFPDLESFFDQTMREHNLDPTITTTDPAEPAGLGNLAAAAMLVYRHDDGANQLGDLNPGAYTDYTDYQPTNPPGTINDLNRWQPLQTPNGNFQGGCIHNGPLITQIYIAPHWGNVTPFALDDGDILTPTNGPALYPSEAFTIQAQEIISISANLTERQKIIAEYWADGPASELPPGHWALFAHFISDRDHHSVDDDAKLFFAVSNANLDAGILAWKLKRIHDSVRPITAINELFDGQEIVAWGGPYSGTMTIDGSEWQPYQESCFVSPAFPEFVSGHSTFSAASAEVFKAFTGSDTFGHEVEIGFSRTEPGLVPTQPLTLHWETFSDAADEAGMSRRYGGIHFAAGDLEGRALGRKVGERVWEKSVTFWDGTATPVADLNERLSEIIAYDDYERVLVPYRAFLPMVVE